MRKKICFWLLVGILQSVSAQDFCPLWNDNMPNSKGVMVKDSIANERVYQVGIPGVYVFEPSKAENKGTAVLIIPGGGYARLAYQISGWQLAKWFNTFGVTAFVLNHRMPQSPDVIVSYQAPLEDAQRAMRYIRSHASDYGIDVNKVGVMGCSAGAHLSACLSTFSEDWGRGGDALDGESFRPDFTILISPVISMGEVAHKGSRDNLLGKSPSAELLHQFSCDERVTSETPPAFIVHATNDRSVSSLNSILYYTALKRADVKKSTLHIFPEGGHNIALRNNPGTTQQWPALAEEWLWEIGMLDRK
ncbi:alpha/beta hydrolase [Bacteroides sp.]